MTPYELRILLHYYSLPGDPEEIKAPIGPRTLTEFIRAGLIERSPEKIDDADWHLTDRGLAYIKLVLDTPFPVMQWVDPRCQHE